MDSLDNEFFEEYKRLDKLCGEIFSCRNGVSEYISQMEVAPFEARRNVPNWDSDYSTLKHLRWVRNQIAHDTDCGGICSADDLRQLKDFRERIISLQDPFAVLRRSKQAESSRAAKPEVSFSDTDDSHSPMFAVWVVLAFVFIALVLIRLFV